MRKLENIRKDKTVQILKKSDSSSLKGGDYIDLLDWSIPTNEDNRNDRQG